MHPLEDKQIHGTSGWLPAQPVAFAWLLCMLMLGGEFVTKSKNPMSLVFYCFLPAVFWMIANDHKRKAKLMIDLKARVDQLEESYRCEKSLNS